MSAGDEFVAHISIGLELRILMCLRITLPVHRTINSCQPQDSARAECLKWGFPKAKGLTWENMCGHKGHKWQLLAVISSVYTAEYLNDIYFITCNMHTNPLAVFVKTRLESKLTPTTKTFIAIATSAFCKLTKIKFQKWTLICYQRHKMEGFKGLPILGR